MITRNARPKRQTVPRPVRPGRDLQATSPQAQNAARLAQLRKMPPIRVTMPSAPMVQIAAYARQLEQIAAASFAYVLPVIREIERLQAKADQARGDASPDEPDPDLQPDPEGISRIGARAGAFEQAKRAARQNKPHTPEEKAQLTLPFTVHAAILTMEKRLTIQAAGLPAEGIAGDAAKRLLTWNAAVNVRVFNTLGLNPIHDGTAIADAREGWIARNAALIRSQPAHVAERVRLIVGEMVPAGSRWETIAARLRDEEGIGERHAHLIARDQESKYNADLTRIQQIAVGISHYQWMGALDNRERPAHVALEGTVWGWDAPPIIGNPGEPIQCRCVAVPVTSDRDIARTQNLTEDQLIARTAALGPTQRQGDDASPEDVRKRATSDVRNEIKLAQNRSALPNP